MIIEMTAPTFIWYGGVSTRATGDAAHHIAGAIQERRRHFENSVSFGLPKNDVLNELFEIAEECKASNWDGYGATPVTEDTYRVAYRLLEALPLGMPVPTVGAEPDGHLTLEWYRSPRRTLSVSISPDGDLHYAALLGPSDKDYGTKPFFDEFPKTILDLIRRVMST